MSGGKKSWYCLRAEFSSTGVTPGSTQAVCSFGSMDKIRLRYFEVEMINPLPTHCPAREVPEALGMIGTLYL